MFDDNIDSNIMKLVDLINSIGLVDVRNAKGSDLLTQHGIDSITIISILVELKNKYNVDLDLYLNLINKLKTFNDLNVIIEGNDKNEN